VRNWIGRPRLNLMTEAGVILSQIISTYNEEEQETDLFIYFGIFLHHPMRFGTIRFIKRLINQTIVMEMSVK
jgi:hypothetical protein